jgi:hypothetical protein
MVRMKMAYGDHRQVAKPRLALAEAKEGSATDVDQNLRLGVHPEQVTCRRALRVDSRPAGPENLDGDRIADAALRRCV